MAVEQRTPPLTSDLRELRGSAELIFLAVCVVIALLLISQLISIEAGAAVFAVALVVLRLFAARLGRREKKLR